MRESATRLQVQYADHNEAFAAYLPRIGVVAGEHRTSMGVGPWILLTLDDPFEFQLKIGEPYQFRGTVIDAFLIRSRWEGCEIGDSDDVAVFILLVETGMHPHDPTIDLDDYVHIAWGTCRPVA